MELENYKAIVFDLGGTLMEFEGMPLNWSDYYYQGFNKINELFGLGLSDADIDKSTEILKSYNPRNKYREYEIMPVVLFDEAMAGWSNIPDIREAIEVFFSGIGLKAKVFDYSKKLIAICKKHGIKVACLTDLPNGMPDSLFRDSIPDIIKQFDLYVSSQTCGYRKPCKAGMEYIAEQFGIDVKDILFVGDEDKDRKTADNAGCSFMHIDEFRKCEETEISEKEFEKKKTLFLEQKKTLDSFLKTGAISQLQYDKSYGDLVKKMGMESVAQVLGYYNGLKNVCAYESEYCDVYYIEHKNVVIVHWKKYCELEEYRNPLECALNIIKDHSGCDYVADTRDGFEDNPLDTKWVAEYFMPKAKEYGCRIIYFIIDGENSLKDELEGQEKDSRALLEFRYIYGIEEVNNGS